MEDSDLLQDLRVFAVAVEGSDVVVDLYGGTHNVCGSVRFTFEESGDRRRHARLVRRWERDATPVSFVARGETITLVNERALIDRALHAR